MRRLGCACGALTGSHPGYARPLNRERSLVAALYQRCHMHHIQEQHLADAAAMRQRNRNEGIAAGLSRGCGATRPSCARTPLRVWRSPSVACAVNHPLAYRPTATQTNPVRFSVPAITSSTRSTQRSRGMTRKGKASNEPGIADAAWHRCKSPSTADSRTRYGREQGLAAPR